VFKVKEAILSLLAGMVIAMIFKMFKLPLPAPPVLAGVMGIVGVYLGGVVFDWLITWLRVAGKQ
jgi:XapX domain-containing protein